MLFLPTHLTTTSWDCCVIDNAWKESHASDFIIEASSKPQRQHRMNKTNKQTNNKIEDKLLRATAAKNRNMSNNKIGA